MALTKWATNRRGYIDGVNTTTASTNWNVGNAFAGPTKAFARRGLLTYDFSDVPVVGSPIVPGSTINSVQLEFDVTSIGTDAVNSPSTIERLTRDDWVQGEATWVVYKTGTPPTTNWTAAGGDVDATTPTPVAYNSPSAIGAFNITGLLAHYNDAVANRSSRLHLRARMVTEISDGISDFWAATPSTIRLAVDWTPPTFNRRGQVI